MKSFMLAVSAVMPLLLFMAVGFGIRKRNILSVDVLKAMNNMIFKVLIPMTLFMNVYDTDIQKAMDAKLLLFVLGGISLSFGGVWFWGSRTIKNRQNRASVVQGIYRSNYVLFGVTIGISICGKENIGVIAALAAVVVPLFNILAVILFETMCGGKVKVGEILKGIVRNPLVCAGILGILVNLAGIPIPEVVAGAMNDLGDIAAPLALIVLGGILSFESIRRHYRYLAAAVAGRLVVLPVIAVGAGILLGFRSVELVAILAIFASPTAVASVPMAQSMGGNSILSGEIVAATSLCSIVTLFCFVFAMSGIGVI